MAATGTFSSGSTVSALKVAFTSDAPNVVLVPDMIVIPGSGQLIGFPIRVKSMTDDGGGAYTITPHIALPTGVVPANGDTFEMGFTDDMIRDQTR